MYCSMNRAEIAFWKAAKLVMHDIHLYGLDVVEAFELAYAGKKVGKVTKGSILQ